MGRVENQQPQSKCDAKSENPTQLIVGSSQRIDGQLLKTFPANICTATSYKGKGFFIL